MHKKPTISSRSNLWQNSSATKGLRSQQERREEKDCGEKYLVKQKYPATGWIFCVTQITRNSFLNFLLQKLLRPLYQTTRPLYITSGESVISTGFGAMTGCNHEEADTRIVVHIIHALQQGMKTVKVRTADTDVIAILVGTFFDLKLTHPCVDIWVAFGTGKSFKYLNINAISSHIGEAKARALPMFHALTGCDTTSAFKGRGKKTAWQAWQAKDMLLCCMTRQVLSVL